MPPTPTAKTKTIQLTHPQTHKTHPIKLIEVQGGIFEMGSNDGWDEEKPVHKVSVPTFWIGKHLVTQSLYEFVMGENPSRFEGAEHPVEQVSWNDCQRFIEKLNSDFGDLGFRLPTESEWEYAARGGLDWKKRYKYAGSNDIEKVAWYDDNSHWESKPVGWKQPNQLGIHDMSGNVWEWCEDDYGSYENTPRDGSAYMEKPRRDLRVLRGGSWGINSNYCRVSYRNFIYPTVRSYFIGLRLVLPQYQ